MLIKKAKEKVLDCGFYCKLLLLKLKVNQFLFFYKIKSKNFIDATATVTLLRKN